MKQNKIQIQGLFSLLLAMVLMASATIPVSAGELEDEPSVPFSFTQHGSYSADLVELAARRAWVYGWLKEHPLLSHDAGRPLTWDNLTDYLRAAGLVVTIPETTEDRTDKSIGWTELAAALQSTILEADFAVLRERILIHHEEALTRGEALQVLCALSDLGCLDPVTVHAEMLRPSEVQLEQLSSVEEAMNLVKASVQTYGAKRILVSFIDKVTAKERQRFLEAYDLELSTEDTGLQCCVDPRYESPLFTCKEIETNRFRIEINHLSPALLAHVDAQSWIRAADRKADQMFLKEYTQAWTDVMNSVDNNIDRCRAAVDWIIKKVDYDTEALRAYERGGYVNPIAHDLKGSMLGRAVCDGQSLLLQFLLMECGIDSYLVNGGVDSDEITHMWVKVKLEEGSYYNVDPTWCNEDQTLGVYFLQPDAIFQANRHVFSQNWQTNGPYASDD